MERLVPKAPDGDGSFNWIAQDDSFEEKALKNVILSDPAYTVRISWLCSWLPHRQIADELNLPILAATRLNLAVVFDDLT